MDMNIQHKRNAGKVAVLSLICIAIPAMAFASPESGAVRPVGAFTQPAATPDAAQARSRGDLSRLGRAHTRPRAEGPASGRARLLPVKPARLAASGSDSAGGAPSGVRGSIPPGRPDWYAIAA